jgi:hypothetical protein
MNIPLPPLLENKLADFRRKVWIVKITEALLAALFGIALSYFLVFVLDRFFETPGWVRLALLAGGSAGLGLGLPLKWHTWVWRQRRLEDAARLVRRTFPRLGDQLLGIVELAHTEAAQSGRSERLIQAAMAQAAEAVADKDLSEAIPGGQRRRWAWATGALAATLALVAAFASEAAWNAGARWLTPWRNVARFTFTRIEPLPARIVIPAAEPVELPVRLAPDTRTSPASGAALLPQQPPISAPLDAGVYRLKLPPQRRDTALALRFGDFRQSVELVPQPRPELTELAALIELPAYLGQKEPQRTLVRGGSVNVVRGARAGFEARASRRLAEAKMDALPQKVEADRILTAAQPVTGDATREFFWQDIDGLTPREPLRVKVRAVDDEPPRIAARRESVEQVILDSEVITFELSASDDFGVKTMGLEWSGAAQNASVHGETTAAGGAPEKREIGGLATFCATRDGVAPQTLEIRAWADDYLPGRKRAKSPAFVFHILSQTDHALWLNQQFGKWLDAAKETYDREKQLHQTNRELRALDFAELDRPANRKLVAAQAAAEAGNASRLSQLNQSGRKLVEHATKNPEFDAPRLESWATMLRSLEQIAAARMPSVSDLLKQTANASEAPRGAVRKGAEENPTQGSQGTGATASQNKGEAPPAAPSPSAPVKPAVPTLADRESGNLLPPSPADTPPKPPGAGKLTLPQTTLAAAPGSKKTGPAPAQSPAQEKLDSALAEQKDLLAEFAKVSDELNAILGSLETSTFVKRLKTASRKQIKMADNIRQETLSSFGIQRGKLPEAEPILGTAKEQSEFVRVIQEDLEAYATRKSDERFKKITAEMREVEPPKALNRNGERLLTNLSGQTLSGSEFWADTLDRWAEELVAASKCKSSSCSSKDSLPPEIVLKVMQALRDEIQLRDQTREKQNAKPALKDEQFARDAQKLAEKQETIRGQTQGARGEILEIPEAASKFGKELRLLDSVIEVMAESRDILKRPETGPVAIAAETEAIELLLQTKRSNPNSGGGGGSGPGGGGNAASAGSAALADFGPGSDAKTVVSARSVGQATGHAGREFPAEYKSGLDAYFNLLEGGKK